MRQIYTWILSAAIPLLTSCTQDELPGNVVPPGNSLYISSAILTSGGHTETEAVTRALVGDVLVPVTQGSLGIFRSKGTGYASTLDNVKYTYTGADKGWQPATAADTLFLNGDDADVCAYYPYNSDTEYTDKTAIGLTSGKYTGTASTHDPMDLCYATDRTLSGSNRATTFELKHAMALLELKITKDADYKGDCRITSVSILNPELITGSTINITDGTYTTRTKDGVLTYNPGTNADGILIGNAASVTAALLIPFNPTADGVLIAFAVNGVPVEAVIPNDKMPEVEAGHRYSVNVTMKATSMQVTGVDMLPWEETGVGGDDYTWYPTEDAIKLDAPIYLAGYKWAWSNLDYVAGEIVLRNYQTWPDGHKVHWPYCVMSANTTGSIVSGSSAYNYATDPCSALNATLGGTWALPTKHQVELLMSTGYANTEKGYWFGTRGLPDKDDGTYLFLPSNTEILQSGGSPNLKFGGYWLSDRGNSELFCVGTLFSDHPSVSTPGVAPYNAMVRCVEKARETITIDGVEWAMGNLVKKDDGTIVIDEHQAAVPPLMSSSVTAGYHFSWNSLTVNPSTDSREYDANNDPCTKVAPVGTWHTPTKEEFNKAIAKGVVNGTYVINNKTISGYYLGTNTQPAVGEGDNYLFLPNTGMVVNGSIYITPQVGYWTNSGGNGDDNFLSFGNNGTVSLGNGKNSALSIRCVKGSTRPTHTIDVDGLDFYVADGNLKAAPISGGHTYSFAAEQGSFTSSTTGGDYFGWNTVLPGSDGTQTVWDDSRDACRKIGDGNWRTPRKEDFEALMGKGYKWGTYYVAGGDVNGVYFGTTSVPSPSSKNKFPFLPAAGFCSGGSYISSGEGRYWSATFDESSNMAYYLSANGSSLGMGRFNTSPAYPLRCIYDK